jgi:hypothetical protein
LFLKYPYNFIIDEVTFDGVLIDCETSIWVKEHIIDLGNELGYFPGQDDQDTTDEEEEVAESTDESSDESADGSADGSADEPLTGTEDTTAETIA